MWILLIQAILSILNTTTMTPSAEITEMSAIQQQYLEQWNKLKGISGRDERNIELVKLMDALQLKAAKTPKELSPFENQLLELYEQEWDHQEIVIRVLRAVGNKRRHDWSKDYFYIFALAGKFKFQIPGEEFGKDSQEEIDRHFRLEPHHPQFEKSSGEINILDIQEMATDRLSRNVWKYKGDINADDMAKYLPEFYGSQPLAKLAKYKECVALLEQKVKEVYKEVVSESENNVLLRKMWGMSIEDSKQEHC